MSDHFDIYSDGYAHGQQVAKKIAAAEITALRAKNERLRAALDWIANVPGSNLAECVNRARAALEENEA